jgi:hypothetical protein
MKKVLGKARKAKPREQPSEQATPGLVEKLKHNIQVITRTDKKEIEVPQGATGGGTEVTVHHGSASSAERSFMPSGGAAEPKES